MANEDVRKFVLEMKENRAPNFRNHELDLLSFLLSSLISLKQATRMQMQIHKLKFSPSPHKNRR